MTADWKKAYLKSAGMGLAVGVGLLVVSGVSGHRLTSSLAMIALVATLATVGSMLAEEALKLKGRPRLATAMRYATLAACVGFTFWIQTKIEARKLTPEERVSLVSVGEGDARRLQHPLLGFSIRHPGPGFTLAHEGATDEQSHVYNYTDGVTIFSIAIYKGAGQTSDSLKGFVTSLDGQKVKLPTGAEVSYEVTRLEIAEAPPRATAEAKVGPNQLRYDAHGIVVSGMSYAVMTSVVSPVKGALADVLDSFQP